MQRPNGPDDTSWWDEFIGGSSRNQAPPPPTPQPPPVDQRAWEKSVEQGHVSDPLGSVHDVGLRIFQETKSYSDGQDSNEPLDAAREKMAWVIMNGDQKWALIGRSMQALLCPSSLRTGNYATRPH